MNPTIFVLGALAVVGAVAAPALLHEPASPAAGDALAASDAPAGANASAAPAMGRAEAQATGGSEVGGRERTFAGTQQVNAAATAPYPTCPLQCTVSYSFLGSGGLEFPVEEGATRVVLEARWDPSSLASERMSIFLGRSEGQGAWYGTSQQGARQVVMVLEGPEPGLYGAWAWPAGPAGAAVRQSVNYVATVAHGA